MKKSRVVLSTMRRRCSRSAVVVGGVTVLVVLEAAMLAKRAGAAIPIEVASREW